MEELSESTEIMLLKKCQNVYIWKKVIALFDPLFLLSTVAEIPGMPEPKVKWYHEDRPLKPGAHYHFYEEDGVHTLEIDGTTEKDKGQYTAEISNQYGSIATKCRLDVNGKILFPVLFQVF